VQSSKINRTTNYPGKYRTFNNALVEPGKVAMRMLAAVSFYYKVK
jgi:hypothetical protein